MFLAPNDETNLARSAAGLAIASVTDTKRRPLQRLLASEGRMVDMPARATTSRVLRQLVLSGVELQLVARDFAVAMKRSSDTPLQLTAPAIDPPEDPASRVLLSMMPRFLRTDVTPTKYIICGDASAEGQQQHLSRDVTDGSSTDQKSKRDWPTGEHTRTL